MASSEPFGSSLNIESCGLGDWYVGRLPDERMREAAKKRGIILCSRAKKFERDDLSRFDLVLAADHQIVNDLYRYAQSAEEKAKIQLITHFSKCYQAEEIPDPYYQGEMGFERVLDMLEDSCEGILEYLRKCDKK